MCFNSCLANYFKANTEKSQFLLTSNEKTTLDLDDLIIKNTNSEKFVGTNIESFLTINEHVSKLCKKAKQTVHAFEHISNYKNKNKLRYQNIKFGYCPLVWMFHDRRYSNAVNCLHEKMLRIIYKDYKSCFAKLPSENKSLTAYYRNFQKLAIEMYKVKNELCLKFLLDLFKEVTHPYNFRNSLICGSYKIKTVRYGTETITYHGPKIWSIIPDEIKGSASLETFRQKVKLWKPNSCPYSICKKYIAIVGFVSLS